MLCNLEIFQYYLTSDQCTKDDCNEAGDVGDVIWFHWRNVTNTSYGAINAVDTEPVWTSQYLAQVSLNILKTRSWFWINNRGCIWIKVKLPSSHKPLHDCTHSCYRNFECTVYPKKYAHGFVVLCFVVVMQSFIMNSHEVFIHIHQGCFAGTGAIVRLILVMLIMAMTT